MRCDPTARSPGAQAPGTACRPAAGVLRPAVGAAVAAVVVALAMPMLLLAPAAAQGYDPMQPQAGAPAAGGFDPMRRQAVGQPSTPAPEGNPELGGLPDAPGAEDTFYLCSACHSIRMVTQQRVSDQRWDYLWDWMIQEQNMPEQDEETREAILGYLKTYFSSER